MQINTTVLETVVNEAISKCGGNQRWANAVRKAAEQVAENPYLHHDGHALLILSPSGQFYEANGVCQCKAYAAGKPCWHRAAQRLVELALAS